jgi:hypothetical protein
MSASFRGTAVPLDYDGVAEVVDRLKVREAELWAVLAVETKGCGFLPDRRPVTLFERHIFSKETNGKFDGSHPDISNTIPGGYGTVGAGQYQRLERAMTLDRDAALRSTSWGIAQVMGFNAKTVGYQDAEAMVTAMMSSENQQLLAMADFIKYNKLEDFLRAHEWSRFAKGYNGPNYAENNYDEQLAEAYKKYGLGHLPALIVRSAQVYLMYLGYKPGPVDGILGNSTRSAINKFQVEHKLPVTDDIAEEQLSALRSAVNQLD